jgi:small subunit ribosomal protein S8
MSMQDPIADMLTRIRNAQAVNNVSVIIPHSKLKAAILKVLEEEGFIQSFETVSLEKKKELKVLLKYFQGKPVIAKIKRVSCPSLRVYKNKNTLPTVLGGMGVAIISTPKGVMTEKTARAQQMGGEVLCTVE